MFAPICREIFTLSFEIMVILDWTSPLRQYTFIDKHSIWAKVFDFKVVGEMSSKNNKLEFMIFFFFFYFKKSISQTCLGLHVFHSTSFIHTFL